MLILYPEILLNSFISSSRCFVDSLGILRWTMISQAYGDCFVSFFPSYLSLIPFSCITQWLELPAQCLIEAISKKTPCLVSYIRRKVLSLSPLNMMKGIIFFTNILNQVEKVPFYSNFTEKVSNRSGCCRSIHTTVCKRDSQWNFAV